MSFLLHFIVYRAYSFVCREILILLVGKVIYLLLGVINLEFFVRNREISVDHPQTLATQEFERQNLFHNPTRLFR